MAIDDEDAASPLKRLRAAYGRAMQSLQAILPETSDAAAAAVREQWQGVFNILYTDFIAPASALPPGENRKRVARSYEQLRAHRAIIDNPDLSDSQKIAKMQKAIARRIYRRPKDGSTS